MRLGLTLLISISIFAAGGCDGATEAMFLVDAPAAAPSGTVTLRIFDSTHKLAEHSVDNAALPGAVIVSSLPAPATLRVVVQASDGLIAADRFDTRLHERVQLRLTLARDLADADGDLIPDRVDDCPDVPDPLQVNQDGQLPGDACPVFVCPSGALCEDFEAPALDMVRWRGNNDHGASSLDSTQHHRGKAALRSSNDQLAMATYGAGAIFETETLPALKDMHLRAFVRVPAGFSGAPASLIKVQQTADPHHGVTLQLDSGGFSIYNDLPAMSRFLPPAHSFPYDKWFCVEWQIQLGSASGTSRVFVDGTEVAGLNAAQDTTATGIDQVSFGLIAYATAPIDKRNIWIDDLVISPDPVGCN